MVPIFNYHKQCWTFYVDLHPWKHFVLSDFYLFANLLSVIFCISLIILKFSTFSCVYWSFEFAFVKCLIKYFDQFYIGFFYWFRRVLYIFCVLVLSYLCILWKEIFTYCGLLFLLCMVSSMSRKQLLHHQNYQSFLSWLVLFVSCLGNLFFFSWAHFKFMFPLIRSRYTWTLHV